MTRIIGSKSEIQNSNLCVVTIKIPAEHLIASR